MDCHSATVLPGRWRRLVTKAGSFAMAAVMMLTLLPRRGEAKPAGNNGTGDAVTLLKTDFTRTELGRSLWNFAHNNGVSVAFDAALARKATGGQYDMQGHVKLSPTLQGEDEVISTAHEIRHVWQDKVLKFIEMEAKQLTPEQRFALRRYIEADAHAFSAYFEADRQRALGMEKPDCGTAEEECKMADKMIAEFSSPDGLTLAEYRKIALLPSFGLLSSYNDQHLEIIRDKLKELQDEAAAAGQSGFVLRSLLAALGAAPDDASFETYLRRYGGASFDPQAPTSLQTEDVSAADILQKYPRRTADLSERIAVLPKLERQLGGMTATYERLRYDIENAARQKPLALKKAAP